MLKKDAKRLVIDPSVLLSASTTQHPISSACRGFLQDVLEISHHVVLTEHIRFEWMERPLERGMRPSRYSLTWLASMHARKKVCRLRNCEDPGLRDRLAELDVIERDRILMEEDTHLLEAALATDRTVVSRDDTVRGLFCQACGTVKALRPVIWVNPVTQNEHTTEWLRTGAEARLDWQLGWTETSSGRDE
jgi:hypothetical protein